MKKHLVILLLLVSSIAVHFYAYGTPNQTVFDEVHFGKFVTGYFTHEYFFDIHPPLGKLLIAGAGYLAGFQPGFGFGTIGDPFPDRIYLALRLLPTLAGLLLPLVMYGLVRQLGMSKAAALAAGFLVLFDNALLTQSRYMLLDTFLLLFGLLAWLCYAKFRKQSAISYLLLASLFAGLSISVKWTGLTFLGIIGILELIRVVRHQARFSNLIVLVAIPFAVYYALFTTHFSLLSKPGPGDAFMSQEFRGGSLSTWDKFVELNREMYRANARLTAEHPYASNWKTWPFMARGIYYWNGLTALDGTMARIYLLGNPLVWWASTIAIVYLIISMVKKPDVFSSLLIGAWFVNLLPFIGISRAMFLYHYFPALLVAIIALVYLLDRALKRNRIFAELIVLVVLLFLFFAPLSYGLPLSDPAFNARMWLPGWL